MKTTRLFLIVGVFATIFFFKTDTHAVDLPCKEISAPTCLGGTCDCTEMRDINGDLMLDVFGNPVTGEYVGPISLKICGPEFVCLDDFPPGPDRFSISMINGSESLDLFLAIHSKRVIAPEISKPGTYNVQLRFSMPTCHHQWVFGNYREFSVTLPITVVSFRRPGSYFGGAFSVTAQTYIDSVMGQGPYENEAELNPPVKLGYIYDYLPQEEKRDLCDAQVQACWTLKNDISASALVQKVGFSSISYAEAGYVIRTSMNGLLLDERGGTTTQSDTSGVSIQVGIFSIPIGNILSKSAEKKVGRTDLHPFCQLTYSNHVPNTPYDFYLNATTYVGVSVDTQYNASAFADARSDLKPSSPNFGWK